jgi:hypothetical protein
MGLVQSHLSVAKWIRTSNGNEVRVSGAVRGNRAQAGRRPEMESETHRFLWGRKLVTFDSCQGPDGVLRPRNKGAPLESHRQGLLGRQGETLLSVRRL